MADSGKTEKATPKKRSDERKKGNIFHSKDVTNAISFIIIVFVIKLLADPAVMFLRMVASNTFVDMSIHEVLTQRDVVALVRKVVLFTIVLLAPIGLLSAATAIVFTGVQTGFLIRKSRLKPQFSRINPVNGFKRIFSLRALVELAKALLKVIIIASVIYTSIKASLNDAIATAQLNVGNAITWTGESIYSIAMSISIYLALFAIADYIYQWWAYEREIMMTKQEIKDEYKQTEGDPQIKSRIKDIQRKLASMRMMKNVKTADVVIRNPTHYAIALKYNPQEDKAPRVVAKGKDYVALKIIEEAERHGIYITENRPLARGLYESAELDKLIPAEFYKPVAEILAFLYKLKKSNTGRKD